MPIIDSYLPFGRLVLACVAAYSLGCLNTGYYLVRLRMGADVRTLGSGNAGARNVGRILGKRAFALTLLGDFLKGSLAVAIAEWLGLPPGAKMAVVLAVVAGHIWPLQLGGTGGKGAATALGAMMVLNVWLGSTVLLIALGMVVLTRAATLSGLVAMALTPLPTWWLFRSPLMVAGSAVLTLLLLYAHRDNLRAIVAAYRYRGQS